MLGRSKLCLTAKWMTTAAVLLLGVLWATSQIAPFSYNGWPGLWRIRVMSGMGVLEYFHRGAPQTRSSKQRSTKKRFACKREGDHRGSARSRVFAGMSSADGPR